MPSHDELIPRPDAVERVLDLRRTFFERLPTEALPLDSIAGRVLAEPIVAAADAPSVSRATMDGFAVDATAVGDRTLLDAESFPEDDPGRIEPEGAIRIATGAPLPTGANAVLKREDATVDGDRLEDPSENLTAGTYVYERGSNIRAGEELFAAGERLSPKDAILLGDLGFDEVAVRKRLSVGVVATGTEIHEGVTRDLDSAMLVGLVRSWGHEATSLGSAPDDYDRVESLLASAAADHDVVVSTGGTSVGKKDHVIRALSALGDVLFHKVRLRPGKPIAVARLPETDAVAFAIPGKPIGAHLVTALVARPFFVGEDPVAATPTVALPLARAVDLGVEGFEYAVPVSLVDGEALPLGHVDSSLRVYAETFDPSVLSSSTKASRADGFVLATEALDRGSIVEVVPYAALE
ncbi:molybdopterin molybdotransferase MoeA [Haloferacaceae archaeon DSL9]